MPKWHWLCKGSLLQRECQACQHSDKYSAVGFFRSCDLDGNLLCSNLCCIIDGGKLEMNPNGNGMTMMRMSDILKLMLLVS